MFQYYTFHTISGTGAIVFPKKIIKCIVEGPKIIRPINIQHSYSEYYIYIQTVRSFGKVQRPVFKLAIYTYHTNSERSCLAAMICWCVKLGDWL